MKFYVLAVLPLAATACPGSPVKMHAKCEMEVTFTDSCESVQAEILGRVNSDWVDPHNGGTYSITNSSSNYISGQRITGDEKYTDLFDYTFSSSGSGCDVSACSESQVNSILDYSTNYCNLHSLYCSSKEGCPTYESDLTYTEKFTSCKQHDDVCVVSSSNLPLHSENKDDQQCSDDVAAAAADITKAGLAIDSAVTSCADGFTSACNQDINAILSDLTDAAADITAAVYSCDPDSEPTACSAVINEVIKDLTGATIAITDAVIDCSEGGSDVKCGVDIGKASAAVVQAGKDITQAVNDC